MQPAELGVEEGPMVARPLKGDSSQFMAFPFIVTVTCEPPRVFGMWLATGRSTIVAYITELAWFVRKYSRLKNTNHIKANHGALCTIVPLSFPLTGKAEPAFVALIITQILSPPHPWRDNWFWFRVDFSCADEFIYAVAQWPLFDTIKHYTEKLVTHRPREITDLQSHNRIREENRDKNTTHDRSIVSYG